jgi:ribulose bisphosphate carboxylase small subunit
MASVNPTFAKHGDKVINFQFVGEFHKEGDLQIKIILGQGSVIYWDYDDTDSRDNGYDTLCDLYLDEV